MEKDYPVKWTTTGWDFEAAGLENSIANDRAHDKPVLNTEFGYQYEPGYDTGTEFLSHQLHQPSTVRVKAWKIATSGAFFAAGFAGTAVRARFTREDVDNFRPAALKVLYDFFTGKTEYWKLAPHLEWVTHGNCLLAAEDSEYVAYFPRGGKNTVLLTAGTFRGEWLHAATGRSFPQPSTKGDQGKREFTPPEAPGDDWVLHLRKE
jgi:hypothetical protein